MQNKEALEKVRQEVLKGKTCSEIGKELGASGQLIQYHLRNYCKNNNLLYPTHKRGRKKGSSKIFK